MALVVRHAFLAFKYLRVRASTSDPCRSFILRKMLFFLLLMLLFRSVCHQVSNQAHKLVLLAIFIIPC